ncbi:cwf18 pre-mRNA splicing factor-domain-containing protein [Desarmillaria tabescens]|uniref:Cwf18 pre-mRNA splicing factor-domain-containing protein n=1 Tax=Armillaria tabescens TaxID=1929756 RepID=A0AA39NIP2_ARMTA|nr:cwf18 pre-mRNA splicing factor-domain-containing protein [Desarmillaria tabescens]KAK0466341.1 cwf18 pre-mRNA splicing factor-domain-containing protein [Desarmillaria tabescens]
MALAEASEARKARLLALKRRKDGEPNGQEDVEMEDTVEKNVEGVAEKIIAEDEQRRAQELDVFNIAPKRPNWDLKRETDKKLAKLERKTQEAIHTLIRELFGLGIGSDTDGISFGAMRAQEKVQQSGDLSDEEDE